MFDRVMAKLEALKAGMRDEEGASAVEYALIAGLIAVVIIGAVSLLGQTISDVFNQIESNLP